MAKMKGTKTKVLIKKNNSKFLPFSYVHYFTLVIAHNLKFSA